MFVSKQFIEVYQQLISVISMLILYFWQIMPNKDIYICFSCRQAKSTLEWTHARAR